MTRSLSLKGSLNELMACKSWCSATFRIELIVLNRFRWVFCQLDRLRHCPSPRIRQALDELPGTLDETYERALLDIGEDNWAYAHRLFQCVVVAQRPLRVGELAEFLAFKSGEGGSLTFEEDWRPEDPRDTVLSTCSSLIAIVNVDGSPVIQFSHFSVKEYFTSTRIAEGRVSRYYIPLEQAHIFVTQACLSFLLQLDKHLTKEHILDSPLARYAGQYWADHAEFEDVSLHTEYIIRRLFNPADHYFANWVWVYDTTSKQSLGFEVPPRPEWALLHLAPLHLTAQHGFHRVAEWLITTCSQDVNISSNRSPTPLHIASRYGRFSVVQVLLKNHADVGARDHTNDDWSPLHYASWYNHPTISRELLKHGASVNSKSTLNVTVVHVVSHNGNLEIAQQLLERGADLNAQNEDHDNPLYLASTYNNLGIVQLLLKHGADPNVRCSGGRTALHRASQKGFLEVAQTLLGLGADVSSRDTGGETPLEVALENGNKQVVQLLLQHGTVRSASDSRLERNGTDTSERPSATRRTSRVPLFFFLVFLFPFLFAPTSRIPLKCKTLLQMKHIPFRSHFLSTLVHQLPVQD